MFTFLQKKKKTFRISTHLCNYEGLKESGINHQLFPGDSGLLLNLLWLKFKTQFYYKITKQVLGQLLFYNKHLSRHI